MTSPIPTDLVQRVARAIVDVRARDYDGVFPEIAAQVRDDWKELIPEAEAVLEATGVEHLQSQLTSMREALELFVGQAVFDPHTHRASVDEFVVSKARAALKRMEQGDDA